MCRPGFLRKVPRLLALPIKALYQLCQLLFLLLFRVPQADVLLVQVSYWIKDICSVFLFGFHLSDVRLETQGSCAGESLMIDVRVLLSVRALISFQLMQVPPAIPALILCCFVRFIRGPHLIIDWHNFAFTLMALSHGTDSFLVRKSSAQRF